MNKSIVCFQLLLRDFEHQQASGFGRKSVCVRFHQRCNTWYLEAVRVLARARNGEEANDKNKLQSIQCFQQCLKCKHTHTRTQLGFLGNSDGIICTRNSTVFFFCCNNNTFLGLPMCTEIVSVSNNKEIIKGPSSVMPSRFHNGNAAFAMPQIYASLTWETASGWIFALSYTPFHTYRSTLRKLERLFSPLTSSTKR